MSKIYHTDFGEFEVDSSKDSKTAALFENGLYQDREEVEAIVQLLDRTQVVCDIGAYLGTTTVPFAKHAKEVHAFEPVPWNFENLKRNVELNACQNIITHQMGLSDKRGNMRVELQNATCTGTSMLGFGGEGERVEISTLDMVLQGNRTDFLKIDVEGMEPAVLRGGVETIRRWRPKIYFEVNLFGLREHGYRVSDISGFLKEHNYELYLNQANGWQPLLSLMLAVATLVPRELFFGLHSGVFNVLAVPVESVADRRLKHAKQLRFAAVLFLRAAGRTFRKTAKLGASW